MSNVMYFDELVNKTAREMNVTPGSIKYAYKFFLEYLKNHVEYSDTVAFELPYIGILHAKKSHLEKVLKEQQAILIREPKNTRARKLKIAHKAKIELIKRYGKIHRRKLTSLLHCRTDRRFYNKATLGKSFEELEIIQNKQYQKYLDEVEFINNIRGG